jgi:glutathione S-transferase
LRRLALNYKGLPYTTVWEHHPDVEARAKAIGAPPTGTKADGSAFYTFPILQDTTAGVVISDSTKIIEYLDSAYPDTPKVNQEGSETIQNTFKEIFRSKIVGLMYGLSAPGTFEVLSASGQEYNRAGWKPLLGERLPNGMTRDEAWVALKAGLDEIDGRIEEGQVFVNGEKPIDVDFEIAASLTWGRKSWGEESDKWKELRSWNKGRWGRLVDTMEKYTV